MERGSGHNDKLDLWKCVAIYSVIFIHILLPGQIGVAVNCLARFAVPLFFLSAGFFSWRSPPRVLARRTVRTAGLLLFACLALLGLGCAMAKHGGASMGAYLLGRFTWANAASLVLWQLFPLPYSWPLGFLAARLMIYRLWWGLTALLLGRLPHRLLAVLALGLLAVHLVLGEGRSLQGLAVDSVRIRNVWLDGLPFFLLGTWMGSQRERIEALRAGRILFLACGLGNPCFSTDSAVVLRAIELECDAILMAKNIDGVYTADPHVDPSATLIPRITYAEAAERDLRVMDAAAFIMLRENAVPVVRVFGLEPPDNVLKVLAGDPMGTILTRD